MPNDWRSVRITYVCSPDIDPAGASDLLMQINELVQTRYPSQVAGAYVELIEPTDFLGHGGSSSPEGPAGA